MGICCSTWPLLFANIVTSSVNITTYLTSEAREDSSAVTLPLLLLYKEWSAIIRNTIFTYAPRRCEFITTQIFTKLTIIIANIGATNPHIAPFSVSIQQLQIYYTMIGYFIL